MQQRRQDPSRELVGRVEGHSETLRTRQQCPKVCVWQFPIEILEGLWYKVGL